MVPRIPSTALEGPVLTASDVHVSVAPYAPKTVRQDTQDAEDDAMDTMYGGAIKDPVKTDRKSDQIYSEFVLHDDMMDCVVQYGSDPTLISVQSSIGSTPLSDVRYSQCNQALIECGKKALAKQDIFIAGWPQHLNEPAPTMRSTIIERGIKRCNRDAFNHHDPIQPDSHMTDAEFAIHGTVAMCNKPLVECLENAEDKWEEAKDYWDFTYPYAS
ncbi:hypothetical protein J4E83_006468 [Alternaria metachromatica]|uniref:uncharacterized protein n=1 Tax=Alternaria metachromatica TaxID=283354 RepID=UPI0020C34335|nr:uncharacterized protein J4E83_006468 [Alternaria metachromatica]KAI4616886.1 hypothetical protein J4E83_006468 [Alternaria metachromatica]